MRILLAAQTYDPPVNGPGVFSRQLAEGFVREGHQVLVLTPSPRLRAVRRLHHGVQVEGVPALPPQSHSGRPTPVAESAVGGARSAVPALRVIL